MKNKLFELQESEEMYKYISNLNETAFSQLLLNFCPQIIVGSTFCCECEYEFKY